LSRLAAARVTAGEVVAHDVAAALGPDGIEVRAASLDAPAGYGWRALRWSCTPSTEGAVERCAGPVRARAGKQRPSGTLALERSAPGWAVALSSGRASARVTVADERPIEVRLRRVPLAWVSPPLASALPKLAPGEGRIDATLAISTEAALQVDGELALDDVAFDSSDGTLAASGLNLRSTVSWRQVDAGRARYVIEGRIESGQWLVAPIFVDHADAPASFGATIQQVPDGYALPAWSWRDEGALVAKGSASLDRDAGLRRLEVERYEATLDRAWPRYAAPALAGGAFASLEATGTVRGRLVAAPGSPLAGEIELVDVTIRDEQERYAVEGLAGALAFAPAEPRTTSLAWRGAALHRIAIGAGSARIVANATGHALAQPLVLDALGGRVRVPRLELAREGEARRVEAAAELESLSVRALTEALGWPAFEGTLSGRIPAVRVEGERIAFDGALELEVFDGRVTLGGLALERAFGVAPSLAADVAIEDLALKPLTEAFSFGTIEGRLDGRVDGLRLVDWKPIAFELALRTDDQPGQRQRISQRAVDALSSVGGAGAGAGIQRSLLRMFDTFPYAEIGISCTLVRNVCTMGGLDSADGGYTIVRGAGLPRLTVIGHQRRVDWPVLVARLEAATEGAGPVID
jgi:hypothetical protein